MAKIRRSKTNTVNFSDIPKNTDCKNKTKYKAQEVGILIVSIPDDYGI